MYEPNSGCWIQSSEENFEEHFETTYYIKYNIEKALYSLNKILQRKIDYSEFSNRCVYYHFYIDNLLNSVAHIRRRFFNKNVDAEKIERNRKEYIYDGIDKNNKKHCNYPTIANYEIRNFIEHIDEKDEALINLGVYNGSFNVIYKGMNHKLKNELLNEKRKQNNLLNLLTKEYKILMIKEDNNIQEYKINLLELKVELEKLKEINEKIWMYLTERF